MNIMLAVMCLMVNANVGVRKNVLLIAADSQKQLLLSSFTYPLSMPAMTRAKVITVLFP